MISFLVACSSEPDTDEPEPMGEAVESAEGFESHPQSHLIPHHDVPEEPLEAESLSEVEDEIPQPIQRVADILNGSIQEGIELEFLYRNFRNLNVASLDEKRLLFMEENTHRFTLYNLESGEETELAEEGRGPGDLMFTREMKTSDGYAWIAMQGFRVSGFDCQGETCEHDRTILTKTNNYSVAVHGDSLTILGLPTIGFDDSPGPEETISQYILHRYTIDGDSLGMFSPAYDNQNPMVRERINAEGKVHYHQKTDRTILISQWLPFLYMYDENRELTQKYRLPEFIQWYYDHRKKDNVNPGEVIGYHRQDLEGSQLYYSTIVDDRWLVLSFTSTTDMEGVDTSRPGSVPDSSNKHSMWYVMDLSTDRLYKIGKDDFGESGELRQFYVTDHGVVLASETAAVWYPE
ncbi:MAG: hypothetical protein WD511_00090 [Balneolaceae bacterium]